MARACRLWWPPDWTRLKRMPRTPRSFEPLEFGVGDARIDHRDAAGGRAELGHRVEGAGIVRAVGRRRDHDGARRADPLLQQAIGVDGRIRRPELGVRRDRKPAVVNVHVAVAGVRRRLQFRRFDARRPGRGLLRLPLGSAEPASRHDRCSHRSQQDSSGDFVAHARFLPRLRYKPIDRIKVSQSRNAAMAWPGQSADF